VCRLIIIVSGLKLRQTVKDEEWICKEKSLSGLSVYVKILSSELSHCSDINKLLCLCHCDTNQKFSLFFPHPDKCVEVLTPSLRILSCTLSPDVFLKQNPALTLKGCIIYHLRVNC